MESKPSVVDPVTGGESTAELLSLVAEMEKTEEEDDGCGDIGATATKLGTKTVSLCSSCGEQVTLIDRSLGSEMIGRSSERRNKKRHGR
ncbi:hypothetical protein Bca4012_038017 [Brassica carinata]